MNKNLTFKIYLPSILLILLFHISFISLPYWSGYYTFKYAVIVIIGCFLIFKLKIILNKRFFKINIILLFYVFLVLLSSYINKQYISSRDTFLAAVIFSAIILEIFFLFEYFTIKSKTNKLINILYYLTLFYVAITDMVLIIKPNLYIEKGMYYLIGNKFVVAYLHLQLIALYLQKGKLNNCIVRKNKLNIIFLCILTLFISLKIECSTGIVGLLIMILLISSRKINQKILKKPLLVIFILIVATLFLFLFSSILDNKLVSYFIVDVLQEDITLTGRMTIYQKINEVLSDHLWLGYGYGSSFEIMMNFMRAPNTQNGLLECILEQGIGATILFISLIYLVFKNTKNSKENIPSVIMIYIYILLSSVEITLGISFLTWIAIVLVTGKYNKEKLEIYDKCEKIKQVDKN